MDIDTIHRPARNAAERPSAVVAAQRFWTPGRGLDVGRLARSEVDDEQSSAMWPFQG